MWGGSIRPGAVAVVRATAKVYASKGVYEHFFLGALVAKKSQVCVCVCILQATQFNSLISIMSVDEIDEMMSVFIFVG